MTRRAVEVRIRFEIDPDVPDEFIDNAVANASVQIEDPVGAVDGSGNETRFVTYDVQSRWDWRRPGSG